jgi:TonB-dependent SusC/RagA subfamily outer membrane receptor
MRLQVLSSFLILVFFSFGCASTSNTQGEGERGHGTEVRPDGGITDKLNMNNSLADFLVRIPGVNVTGSGNNVQVTIRGVSSFMAGNDPLYVIDGQIVGTDYAQVNNLLNVRDIDNVRALKGSDAGMYGVRGANGVILITTKR